MGTDVMKIARSHIMQAIEEALSVSGPVEKKFKKYTLSATPYRLFRKRGNHGVRVTWVPNA